MARSRGGERLFTFGDCEDLSASCFLPVAGSTHRFAACPSRTDLRLLDLYLLHALNFADLSEEAVEGVFVDDLQRLG